MVKLQTAAVSSRPRGIMIHAGVSGTAGVGWEVAPVGVSVAVVDPAVAVVGVGVDVGVDRLMIMVAVVSLLRLMFAPFIISYSVS